MGPRFRVPLAPSLPPIAAILIAVLGPARTVRADDPRPPSDALDAALAAVSDASAARGPAGAAVVAFGERAVPALRRRLDGGTTPSAEAVAILLGRLGGVARPALDDLVLALEDDEDRVRAESAAAIEAIGWPDGATLDALVAKVGDPDPAVRRVAFRAALDTGRVGPEAVAARIAEHETRLECTSALRGLHGRAVETLASLLDHPSRRVRTAAVEALATSGPAAARVAPALAEAAHATELGLRRAALAALLASGDSSAPTRRALLDAARAPEAELRSGAVFGLADARFDGPETAKALEAAAADPDARVRLYAATGEGLRGRASPAQRALLARTAVGGAFAAPYADGGHRNLRGKRADGWPSVDEHAAWRALRVADEADVLEALRSVWPGATGGERVNLLRAFQAMGTDGAPDLRSHLADPSPLLRREAALCLATLGDAGADAVPVLVGLLDEPTAAERPEDDSGRGDAAIVVALAARMPAALSPLVAALEAYASAPGRTVRPPPLHVFEVLEAAGTTAAPAATAAVRVVVETPLAYPGADAGSYTFPADALRALRAIGDAAVGVLAARLSDPDRDVRWRARHALADLGGAASSALEALDRAASAGPEDEREQAAYAARRIRTGTR